MSPTVQELQNSIRSVVGRFERDVSAQFTKEELARVANEVGYEVDVGAAPPKSQMRAGIRWQVGISEDEDSASGSPFKKSDLQSIATELGIDTEENPVA